MPEEESIENEIREIAREEVAQHSPNIEFPEVQKVEVTNFPETKAPIVNVKPPAVKINVPKQDPPIVEVEAPDLSDIAKGLSDLSEKFTKLAEKEYPQFNYSEFERIAQENRSTYRGGAMGPSKIFLQDKSGSAINPATAGEKSTNNSTTTPLGSGETYTGTGEQNHHAQVMVYCISDTAGTLFLDWSNDGSTWYAFPVAGIAVLASIPKFWVAVKGGRYFRVRFVNSASAQSSFDLSTYFNANFVPSVSALGISWNKDDPAQLVRIGSDHALDISRGFAGGQSGVGKFGANPNVAASSTEDVIFTGTINWLTAATTVRIKSGGNTNDTSSGSGAQQVIVEGLDENWEEASETITTNGSSASTATTTTFIRLNRAYVGNVGTYTGANTGNITIENSGGGTDLLTIEAGVGQTQSSAYTIPAGKTGYLTRVRVGSTTAKASDISFWQRRNADDVTTPFTGKRLVRRFLGVAGSRPVDFETYPSFPARTDLWASITTGSGAAGAGEIAYDLILVDD